MLATKLIHAHLNDNWPSLGTGRVRLPTLGFGKEQYFLSTDLIQKQTMLETNIDTKLQLLQMSLLLLNLLLLLSLLSLLELWFLVQCLAVKDAAKQLSGMRIAIVCLGKLFFSCTCNRQPVLPRMWICVCLLSARPVYQIGSDSNFGRPILFEYSN